jgi:hypothetical protein
MVLDNTKPEKIIFKKYYYIKQTLSELASEIDGEAATHSADPLRTRSLYLQRWAKAPSKCG